MADMTNFFGLESGSTTIAESYDTKTRKIKKLSEIEQQRIYGYMITAATRYGEGVLLCGENDLISLPKRYVEKFKAMNEDQRSQLKSGRVWINGIEKIETNQGETYTFRLVTKD